MKFSLLVLGCVSLSICTSIGFASAGQIWTDGNSDGLPDVCPGVFTVPPSSNVTVGIWIDSQSFVWTSFLAHVEWGECVSYVSAEYVITGGFNLPFVPGQPLAWTGTGYIESGVDHIGNLTLHVDAPVNCCVTPVIEPETPGDIFSLLVNGLSNFLFTTNPGTCFGSPPPSSGACCFPDGVCLVLEPGACASSGGAYQGDCTVCGGCASTNVESTSWGSVKGLYR